MRLKGKGAKSLLALRLGEPAGLVEEPASGAPAVVPYRLVPVAEAGPDAAPAQPAVLVASNARMRSPKPVLALQQPDFSQLEQVEALARQQSGAAPAASGEQQADAAAAAAGGASAPTTASGRPQRKRKAPQYADDMIPTDVLSRRGSRPRPAPAAANPRPAGAALPVTLSAAGGAPGAVQLVTMNTAGGGTVTGLAVPAAALLPALLQQQQLLRGQSGAGAAGAMPYKLVAPGGEAPPSSSSDAAAAAAGPPPAVKEAAPRDVVQVARQLDEEERKKALAAADARVMLRVLPGAQAGRSKDGFAVPAPRPPTGRKSSTASGAAARGRGTSRLSRKPTPDTADQQLPQLPPYTWHPGFESHGGVTVVSIAEAVAAPPLPAVVVGEAARTTLPVLVDDPLAQVGAGPWACSALCSLIGGLPPDWTPSSSPPSLLLFSRAG